MQKNTYKRLLMITLAFLFTFTIVGTVSAASYDTDLTLNPINPSTVQVGDSVTFTAQLKRAGTNSGVRQQTIHFYVNGVEVGTGTTNNQGVATYTGTAPTSSAGIKNVQAKFEGGWYSGDYYRSDDSNIQILTVTAPNRNPVANPDSVTTSEDNPVDINVRANDNDPDGDSLNINSYTQPSHGTTSIVGGNIRYTPTANYHGPDSFTYTVNDGKGGISNTATVSITVNSVNDAPTAVNDAATTNEDTPISINVLANDFDVDIEPIYLSQYGWNPTYGNLNGNWATGVITYTPAANWYGTFIFDYGVADSSWTQSFATVTVTVNPVNDAPVASDDSKTTNEDTPVSGTVTANDVEGNTLTFSQGTGPANGVVTVNPTTGAYTYTPNANWNGIDTFTINVSDGNGGTDTATVTITVTPVNDAPVANDDAVTTNEDTPVVVDVLANDSDVEGNPLLIIDVTPPSNGSVSLIGGVVTYYPNPNWFGTATFQYTIYDYNGGVNTATVTVTVNPVNDAPVATGDSKTTNEDTPVNGAVTATDADGDSLTFTEGTGPSNGNVIVNTDGSYTYTPNANWNGIDTFTVVVSDGKGGTDTATVTITVNAVNDAPVADDATVNTNEDTPLSDSLAGSDIDGDSLTFALGTGPSNGVVTVNSDGTYTYTPNTNYNGPDSFTFIVNDGNSGTDEGTVTITVNSVNDNPVAADDTATTKEDTPVTIDVLGNDSDVDGDTLTVTGVSDPANGTVTINTDGTVTYTPDANYYGSDSFTYTLSDGKGGQTTGTVNISVVQKVSSVYVLTTVSKNNPTVGETIKITFKLGNNGPDTAENVKFTYILPEGLEFVSISGDGSYRYDAATRTITWNLGDVPVGDPYLYVNVKVLKAGSFVIDPTVTTDTFDTALPASVQSVTINAVEVVKAASSTTSNTVGMQETGLPIGMLVLAILAVLGGLIAPKRK